MFQRVATVICCLSSVFCQLPSTTVESSLQINLFMQNKPNFRKSQMNVSFFYTKDYENISDWTLGESKPNSKPIKPNFRNGQNERKLNFNKGLQKKRLFSSPKNKPKTNPILSAVGGLQMNISSILTKDYEEKCG